MGVIDADVGIEGLVASDTPGVAEARRAQKGVSRGASGVNAGSGGTHKKAARRWSRG